MDPAPDEGEGEGEGGAAAASSSQAAEEARPVSQQQPQPQPLSRYELQKRRDWNTFLQYLRNHKPPLTLPRCSGAHVIEFLKYLDQFGKTKVHADACAHFGQPNPPAPCACPLRQAWGSLDALIGRLRAAYDESGGRPDSNPFAARAVRIYLREVREAQAKARGIPYDKKKRKRAASGSTSAAVAAPPPVITAEAAGPSEDDHEEKPPQPTEQTEKSTTMVAPPHASSSANTTSGSAGASSSTSAAATVTTTMTATAAAAVGKEAMPPQGPAPPSS